VERGEDGEGAADREGDGNEDGECNSDSDSPSLAAATELLLLLLTPLPAAPAAACRRLMHLWDEQRCFTRALRVHPSARQIPLEPCFTHSPPLLAFVWQFERLHFFHFFSRMCSMPVTVCGPLWMEDTSAFTKPARWPGILMRSELNVLAK